LEEEQAAQAEQPAAADPMEAAEKRKEDFFARLKEVAGKQKQRIYDARTLRAQVEDKMRETGINAR